MKFHKKNKITTLIENYGLNKLLVNSGQVFSRRVLGLGLSFFWTFLITNFFGSETYGLVSLSQVIIGFSGMVFGLGIDVAIVKLASSNKHYYNGVFQSDFFKKSLIIVLVSALFFSVLLYLFKDLIAQDVFNNNVFTKYLLVISYLFLFFITHTIVISFLTVRGEFVKYGNFYFLFPNACILIFVLIIYLLRLPNYYIIAAYLLSYGIFGLILLFSFSKIPQKIINTISYSSILKLSTPMMISSSFLFISSWTDTFMLGVMVSKSDLGVYNIAFKLASLALIIIATVNTVLAPKISKLYSQGEIEQIKIEVRKATKIITYLALPLVGLLILFRTQILGLFGNEFVAGGMTLIIISLGMLFNAMCGSVGQILNMTNHQKQFRNFTIVSAAVNIILNYFLIKKYGIEGAAFASLISVVLINLLCLGYIKLKFNFYAFFKL